LLPTVEVRHSRAVDRPDLRRSWPLLFVCVLAVGLYAPSAMACATCECGDPTLVVMGAEQPFANRLRPSLALRHRTDAVGRAGIDRAQLQEQRLELAVAYAPTMWLMLSASVPFLRRQLEYTDLSRDGYVGLGDSELRARVFVYRDRDFAPQHLLALSVGTKLPTGPVKEPRADLPNSDLVAGTGSFDPLVGATYSYFAQPWSFFVSEMMFIPTRGSNGVRVGSSWRGTHTAQLQLHELLGVRLSAETRLEARSSNDSANLADTGGFIAFAAPGIVVSPLADLVIQFVVHVPVLNALHGTHDEGVVVEIGAALDL